MHTRDGINNGVTYHHASRWLTATSAILYTCAAIFLTGCSGGSGGANSVPDPLTPTPTPTPTTGPPPDPGPKLSAKDRSIKLAFTPNYIPVGATQYLHWSNTKNLRVFIYPPVNNIAEQKPSSTIDSGKIRNIVEQAIANWTTVTDGDFTFTIVNDVNNSDIQVHFVDQLLNSENAIASGVGLTNYDFVFPNGDDKLHANLQKSVIQVLAHQADPNLVDTTAHELGHSLGIEKHSLDNNDLMYAVSLPPATITQRDQNTLFFLYYSPVASVGRSVPAGRHVSVSRTYSEEIICGANDLAH